MSIVNGNSLFTSNPVLANFVYRYFMQNSSCFLGAVWCSDLTRRRWGIQEISPGMPPPQLCLSYINHLILLLVVKNIFVYLVKRSEKDPKRTRTAKWHHCCNLCRSGITTLHFENLCQSSANISSETSISPQDGPWCVHMHPTFSFISW